MAASSSRSGARRVEATSPSLACSQPGIVKATSSSLGCPHQGKVKALGSVVEATSPSLGTFSFTLNSSGTVVRSYEYDAFGQVSNPPSVDAMFSTDPYANRFLYTGREFLKEVGLYDYRNRIYSADLGRFLQTDPIRFDAGDVNLYRYVSNNPINLIDPTGEIAFVPILLGIGIGMAIDWAYDEFASDHVNDFINDNFDCETQANLRTAGSVIDVARSIKNPVRGANNIRQQVFKKFPTRKKAKDAAANSPGGPWQKDGKTMGPEKHKDTPPHYHDGNHDDPTKPNTHYQFPDSQY